MTVYTPNSGISFSSISTMPVISSLNYLGSTYTAAIDFPVATTASIWSSLVPGTPNTNFAATWTGQFLVITSGTYTFCTDSDDGSTLYVDGSMVVNNFGLHPSTLVCSTATLLSAGTHALSANYFQAGGDVAMMVTYSGPDTGYASSLVQFYATGTTACTSCVPGTFSTTGAASSCSWFLSSKKLQYL